MSDNRLHTIKKLDTGESFVTHPLRGTDVGVRLPSGLIHWFYSEKEAVQSQYWPREAARRDVALANALEEVAAILDEPRYEQLEALADLIQRLIAQDAVK